MFQKKSLGQNFLKSERALKDIVLASEVTNDDIVLEIGPGEGVLTSALLETNPSKLFVVEKDDRLIPILQEKFKVEIESGKMLLAHGDIIDIFEKGFESIGIERKPFKVVANIPYYITGLIMRHLFSLETLPSRVVLLVQKEVADRITDHKKNNLLRTSTTLYGKTKRISVVPRGAFVPAPNVDSAIICIYDIEKPVSKEFEDVYFAITKGSFAHKRKKASKNLDEVLGVGFKEWEKLLNKAGLPADTRAEDISTNQFKEITSEVLAILKK